MKLSDLAKKILHIILLIALASIVLSFIYYRSSAFIPFSLGVLLGSAVSVWKVFLLDKAVDNALSMEKNRASAYAGIQHLLRLALSGAALLLGALIPQLSLWGVVTGILAFQISLYFVKFTGNIKKKDLEA